MSFSIYSIPHSRRFVNMQIVNFYLKFCKKILKKVELYDTITLSAELLPELPLIAAGGIVQYGWHRVYAVPAVECHPEPIFVRHHLHTRFSVEGGDCCYEENNYPCDNYRNSNISYLCKKSNVTKLKPPSRGSNFDDGFILNQI